MRDRIEHTEHKRRDRRADTTTDMRFGERRYGGSDSEDAERDERADARR